MTTDSIGPRIRALRVAHRLSRAQLAERLELKTPSRIAKIEQGRSAPSDELIAQLTVVFGVSERFLRTGKEIEDGPGFEDTDTFRIYGKPKERCTALLYPQTLAKVKALSVEYGISIPETLDQIVEYALRHLKT